MPGRFEYKRTTSYLASRECQEAGYYPTNDDMVLNWFAKKGYRLIAVVSTNVHSEIWYLERWVDEDVC